MNLWLGIVGVVFAVALAVVAWRRLRPTRGLVIDRRGILDPSLGWGLIPWEEIEGAYPPESGRRATLRVKLRVTERLARVLQKRRHEPVTGTVEIHLDLSHTDLDPLELMRRIVARSDQESIAGGSAGES